MKKLSKAQLREMKEWVDKKVDKFFKASIDYSLNEYDKLVILLTIKNDVLEDEPISEYELKNFKELKEQLEHHRNDVKDLTPKQKDDLSFDWDWWEESGKRDDILVNVNFSNNLFTLFIRDIDNKVTELEISKKEMEKWLKEKGYKYGFEEGEKDLKDLDVTMWNLLYTYPANIKEYKYMVVAFSMMQYLGEYFEKEIKEVLDTYKTEGE